MMTFYSSGKMLFSTKYSSRNSANNMGQFSHTLLIFIQNIPNDIRRIELCSAESREQTNKPLFIIDTTKRDNVRIRLRTKRKRNTDERWKEKGKSKQEKVLREEKMKEEMRKTENRKK